MRSAALALGLIATACGGQAEPDDRAETDRSFARVAMGILADAATAELAYFERTGAFTADAEAAGLPTEALGDPEAEPAVCLDHRVLVLGETTPHGAAYALKLDATSDPLAVSHYDEPAPCDDSQGPETWRNGCRFDPASGLVCPEEER